MTALRSRFALTLMIAGLGGAPAIGQTTVSGFELERLELDPSGLGSLAMGSGRLLAPWTLRLAAALSYANSPLLAVRNGEPIGALVRDRFSVQLAAALSVHDRVELGAALPLVLLQLGDDLTAHGVASPAANGLGAPWVVGRFSISEDGELIPFDLAAQLAVSLPFGSIEALAASPGIAIAPKALLSKELGALLASAELGLLLRQAVPLGVEQVGPQLTLGGAVVTTSGLIGRFRPELALRARVPLTGQVPATELFFGGRMPVGSGVNAFGLFGLGLGRAPGTPLFLIVLGASFDTAGGDPKPASRRKPAPAADPVPSSG